MAVQIGGKPDSGFDDPLGMLSDCHRRIERFLDVLCRVAERAGGRPLNREESDAVESALRYFFESGPRHNCDEEESLFPRLRGASTRMPAELLPQIDRLHGDHRHSEALHKETAELFARWRTEGDLHLVDRQRLRAVLTRLQQIYSEHIRLEEDVVFPCAARLFDPRTVAAMGAEFRARRA